MERCYHAPRDGLAPWYGDGHALRALRMPERRQLDAWRARVTMLDRQMSEIEARQRDLVTSQRTDEARIAAIQATVGVIEDGEALRLRAARDTAWVAHARALDAGSAASLRSIR